jgi:purine-binding chemotaxis protein CheW
VVQLCLLFFLIRVLTAGQTFDRGSWNEICASMKTTTNEAVSDLAKGMAGRYLTFQLGQESYGIAVMRVREIIRMTEVTGVPQLPPHIKGVINLRGKIIPILDLRCRFELSRIEDTERTCIVVVQVRSSRGGYCLTGLIVDAVEEVVQVSAGDVETAPNFGGRLQAECIRGMAKIKGRIKALLDIDRVVMADSIHLASGVVPETTLAP